MAHFKETLTASWQESLALCKPKTLGLLLLVSLRTLLTAYRAILYAWSLPLMYIVGLIAFIYLEAWYFGSPTPATAGELTSAVAQIFSWGTFIFYYLIMVLYLTIVARAARPSIDYKNASYWRSREMVGWVIFAASLTGISLLAFLPSFYLPTINGVALLAYLFFKGVLFQIWPVEKQVLRIAIFNLTPLLILWILFMLDARKTVGQYALSLWRAFLMLFYNYPFFFIVYASLRLGIGITFLLSRHFALQQPWHIIGWLALFIVIIPYYVCFLTNVYVKRLHEQFAVYYRG